MSDRASTDHNPAFFIAPQKPQLHPAPGRAILRIVPRLGLKGRLDEDKSDDMKTDAGVILALDGRRPNQPMVGSLEALGDPTSEREKVICEWAVKEAEAGRFFIFSQYGAGSEYWEPDMEKMLSAGYDFGWLKGYRLFDIGQLSCTASGTGTYGEIVRMPSLAEVTPNEETIQ